VAQGERVDLRPELPERAQQPDALALRRQAGRLHEHERAAPQLFGDLPVGRHVEDAADRRDRVGNAGGPRLPGLQDLGGALLRPEQRARVQLPHGIQGELERGDDPEAAPATAQRPEEVGLVLAIDMEEPAVGGHDVDGKDAVAGEAVAPGEPSQPTAQGVAHHPDLE
jgi:hypothetical protein